MDTRQAVAIGVGAAAGASLSAVGARLTRFYLGRRRADQAWASARYAKLRDVGTVKSLSILPLIDHKTARNDLAGEGGVSYLVQADDTTLLFDLGLNAGSEHPSPLLRNMEALGVDSAGIDFIVISHMHGDHVGGRDPSSTSTFALSREPVDLCGVTAFVPQPMTHATAEVRLAHEPRVIAPGVATMGTIPRQLFFMGWTPEQSLAVNVEGKGVVIVVGCGHSTLPRIVDRAEMLFDAPIYGLVGGLHYPVNLPSQGLFTLPRYRFVATGKWPWHPITEEDVRANIAYLQRQHPNLVALSPHDSSDWSIEAFRQGFGSAYQDLLVGKEIMP